MSDEETIREQIKHFLLVKPNLTGFQILEKLSETGLISISESFYRKVISQIIKMETENQR